MVDEWMPGQEMITCDDCDADLLCCDCVEANVEERLRRDELAESGVYTSGMTVAEVDAEWIAYCRRQPIELDDAEEVL